MKSSHAHGSAYSGNPVIKLGGVTVADADKVQYTLKHIDWHERPLLVVSAPAGVTDILFEAARKQGSRRSALLYPIRQHFAKSANMLLGEQMGSQWITIIDDWLQQQAQDADQSRLVARGELWNASLIAAYLQTHGKLAKAIDARAFIRFDTNTKQAVVKSSMMAALNTPGTPVVTGFIARDRHQKTCTLGRDGSDYSAALIAVALSASRVDFITSTQGIRSADPHRLGANGIIIPAVNYRCAQRITQWGGGVLHPRTIEPLHIKQIPARIFTPGQAHLATHIQSQTDWPVTGLGIFHRTSSYRYVEWLIPCASKLIAIRMVKQLQQLLPLSKKLRHISCQQHYDQVYVRCPRKRQTLCLHVLHDILYGTQLANDGIDRSIPNVNVILYGPGKVGSAVLQRIREQNLLCRIENGFSLQLRGIVNSKGAEWIDNENGNRSVSHECFREYMDKYLSNTHCVIIDTTSSPDVATQHLQWLQQQFAVVTANKLALSSDQKDYLTLTQHPLYAASTTVGAGLPMIKTLKQLRNNNQIPRAFSAVLSGSINYLLSTLNEGSGFDQALSQAINQGLVEPDPSADLSGLDTARKAIILSRYLGDTLSLADVKLEPLPDKAKLERLHHQASQQQQRLAYLVSWHPGHLEVKLESIANNDEKAVAGVDNVMLIHTDNNNPIRIAGPGAGIGVTADGVYRDLLQQAHALLTMYAAKPLRRAAA